MRIDPKGTVAGWPALLVRRTLQQLRTRFQWGLGELEATASVVSPPRRRQSRVSSSRDESTRSANCCDHFGKRAAVIEVPVRQENALDCREIDAETPGVVKPDAGVGTSVEEHAALLPASTTGDQHRETVTAAAKLVDTVLQLCPLYRRPSGVRAARWMTSGTCGTPSSTLDNVSVSLSTTTRISN